MSKTKQWLDINQIINYIESIHWFEFATRRYLHPQGLILKHMSRSRTGILALAMLYLGGMLLSCNVSKNTRITPSVDSIAKDSPRILFLNYEISRDGVSETYSARLINTVAAEGSLKKAPASPVQAAMGDLELQVLDVNEQLLSTHLIPNPLDKFVEFVNDTGTLEQKKVSLESAQISVRLQVEPGASSAILRQITGPDSESIVLLKTSIL